MVFHENSLILSKKINLSMVLPTSDGPGVHFGAPERRSMFIANQIDFHSIGSRDEWCSRYFDCTLDKEILDKNFKSIPR